jgi:hypothetical protein
MYAMDIPFLERRPKGETRRRLYREQVDSVCVGRGTSYRSESASSRRLILRSTAERHLGSSRHGGRPPGLADTMLALLLEVKRESGQDSEPPERVSELAPSWG